MKKKILVSGVQSSGRLHIGNYFGAIRQNVELGNSGEYDSYVFIADYHSMTSLTDAADRRENTFDAACVYLACGLDPEKVTFFKQSDVPGHTELSWILNTVTPMATLLLAHSFKDKINFKYLLSEGDSIELNNVNTYNLSKDIENRNIDLSTQDEIKDQAVIDMSLFRKNNSGLLIYPVLMAADILMYNADVVPVGKDQEQHLEITRELAGKYNRAYGVEQFTMPKAHIVGDVATVPGVDGRKMSKSYDNHIPLFGTPEEIKKRIMSIVTDSAAPADAKNSDENNIYQIHKLFLNEQQDKELRNKFEQGGYGYKQAKDDLLETVLNFTAPMREKYDYYRANPQEVTEILNRGAEKARNKARETMGQIKKQTGLDS